MSILLIGHIRPAFTRTQHLANRCNPRDRLIIICYPALMNITEQRVLEYVHSVKGGPTKADFATLHGPVGALLLTKLINIGLLREAGDERVHLTDAGRAALRS